MDLINPGEPAFENREKMSSDQNNNLDLRLAGSRLDFQRFITAINRQEPDRLPFTEFIIKPDIRAAFLRRPATTHEDQIEFFTRAEYGCS